jgi:hypothetical protein
MKQGQSMRDMRQTKWHWGRFFSEFFGFPYQYHSTIAPTHLSSPHEVSNSPDQAAHYHTLGPKLGASSVTRQLAGTEERSVFYHERFTRALHSDSRHEARKQSCCHQHFQAHYWHTLFRHWVGSGVNMDIVVRKRAKFPTRFIS